MREYCNIKDNDIKLIKKYVYLNVLVLCVFVCVCLCARALVHLPLIEVAAAEGTV